LADSWWKHGGIYRICPCSYLHTDGDAIGELDGGRRRLDDPAADRTFAFLPSPMTERRRAAVGRLMTAERRLGRAPRRARRVTSTSSLTLGPTGGRALCQGALPEEARGAIGTFGMMDVPRRQPGSAGSWVRPVRPRSEMPRA